MEPENLTTVYNYKHDAPTEPITRLTLHLNQISIVSHLCVHGRPQAGPDT